MNFSVAFLILFFIALSGVNSIESDIKSRLQDLKNHRIPFVNRRPGLNHQKPKPKGLKGGDYALSGQFTYAVSLQYNGDDICGGGIIRKQFVVTAAHCVIDLESGEFLPEQLTVLTNVIDLYDDSISENKIKVEKVYALNEFKPEALQDATERVLADIAVLKLDPSAGTTTDSFSMKLRLPVVPSKPYTGVRATIVGFGWDHVRTFTDRLTNKTYESGQSSGRLRHALTSVISNKKCGEVMSTIRNSNICAQVKQRRPGHGEGACSGDSGGPLVYDGTLIGVLSTSPFGCEETEGSGVYTRVSSYLDFIQAAIDDEVSEDIRVKVYRV